MISVKERSPTDLTHLAKTFTKAEFSFVKNACQRNDLDLTAKCMHNFDRRKFSSFSCNGWFIVCDPNHPFPAALLFASST